MHTWQLDVYFYYFFQKVHKMIYTVKCKSYMKKEIRNETKRAILLETELGYQNIEFKMN